MNSGQSADASDTSSILTEIETARRAGRLREALEKSLQLIVDRAIGGGELTTADRVLIEQVADMFAPVGRTEQADRLLMFLTADCRRRRHDFAGDYITLKRAELALASGSLARALQTLEGLESRVGRLTEIPFHRDRLPAWEDACSWGDAKAVDRALFFSRLYLNLGRYLLTVGQYGHAAMLIERGLEHSSPPASSLACRAHLPLTLALGQVFLAQGRLDACLRLADPLKSQCDERQSPGWLVSCLELVAECHLLRGQYGLALEHFAKVSEICRDGQFPAAALRALLNEAEILILLNQTSVAEELLLGAEHLATVLKDRGLGLRVEWLRRVSRLRNRSLAAEVQIAPTVVEMQRGREAPLADDSGDLGGTSPYDLPSTGCFVEDFQNDALAVEWALSRGRIDQAERLLGKLRDKATDVESPLIQLRLHCLCGKVAYDSGDFAAADRIFGEAEPHLEKLGLKPDLWQATRFRAWCAQRADAPREQLAVLTGRAQRLVEELASSLPPAQLAIYLLNKWTVEEQSLRQEIIELETERMTARKTIWFRRPLALWRLGRRLYALLARLDQHRRQLASFERVEAGDTARGKSFWRSLWEHPRCAATISFLVLPDCVFVARAGWLRLDFHVSPLGRLATRNLVAEWHRHVAADASAEELKNIAGRLMDGLGWGRLLDELPGRVNRLRIVADDSLHGAPFAALPYRGGYLIEHFALCIGYDRTSTPVRSHRQTVHDGLAIAVARGTNSIPSLPATLAEVAFVGAWLREAGVQPTTLVDDDARKDRVLEAWCRTGLVHVACHGVFEPNRPDASGLVLIPARERVELLSLRELAQLDLSHLSHVSLSCCWGADNFVLPGWWIISLPEVLCRQGTGSVLGSLWPIEDEMGRRFFQRFYENVRSLPRDLALQATQCEFLANPGDHPFSWAGFRLCGYPGPLVMLHRHQRGASRSAREQPKPVSSLHPAPS